MLIKDIVNSIYSKSKLSQLLVDLQTNILLVKWISQDPTQISKVAKLLKYLWYVEPLTFYYLLFFSIDKKQSQYYKKYSNEKAVNKVHDEIQQLLRWSDRERKLNQKILDLAFKDEKHWKTEFGIK